MNEFTLPPGNDLRTRKQKEEAAINYMRKFNISFGCREADDRAIEMAIDLLETRDEVFETVRKTFIDAHTELFRFHADAFVKHSLSHPS